MTFAYPGTQKNILEHFDYISKKGDRVGIAGESGAGKSTILRLLLRFYAPTKGQILINGIPIEQISFTELHQRIAFLEQDTYLFDATIAENIGIAKPDATVEEIKTAAKRAGIAEFIETLPDGYDTDMGQMSARLSGGERQRIGIARALAVQPQLIIADEPVSALDVSIQAQILNLLMDLKDEFNFSYLFIAHDLSVVRHISDRLGVMYLGSIVEMGDKHTLFTNPVHPYTKVLFAAVPTVGEKPLVQGIDAKGEIPSPVNLPKGCYFSDRCPYATDRCLQEKPVLREVEPGHMAACHLL